MLKVAIVGCGKIADEHAAAIQRIQGSRIVGVCDREELMARQLGDRFGVQEVFSDLRSLFERTRPDVIHLTTPPQSHFNLAQTCLENGCHVYVEKPFTLETEQAVRLIDLAERKGFKLTVGHDAQFSHAARYMRQLIGDGFLGGAPVHMECYYCYPWGTGAYARALLSDQQHWVRKLPGQLLQNIISHGIAKIAEFLSSDSPQVTACGFSSPFLRARGETDLVDELRVIILDTSGTTAYFTFSSGMRPSLHQFRIYGSKNGLLVDDDEQIVLKLRGAAFKSYANKVLPAAVYAKQCLENAGRNMRAFLRRDFHMNSGMKYLIEAFYQSIVENKPPPIAYHEILRTSRIMDSIFAAVKRSEPASDRPAHGACSR